MQHKMTALPSQSPQDPLAPIPFCQPSPAPPPPSPFWLPSSTKRLKARATQFAHFTRCHFLCGRLLGCLAASLPRCLTAWLPRCLAWLFLLTTRPRHALLGVPLCSTCHTSAHFTWNLLIADNAKVAATKAKTACRSGSLFEFAPVYVYMCLSVCVCIFVGQLHQQLAVECH